MFVKVLSQILYNRFCSFVESIPALSKLVVSQPSFIDWGGIIFDFFRLLASGFVQDALIMIADKRNTRMRVFNLISFIFKVYCPSLLRQAVAACYSRALLSGIYAITDEISAKIIPQKGLAGNHRLLKFFSSF